MIEENAVISRLMGVVFVCQELTVELMAAKVELEAYVNSEHPHPQYLSYHISTCNDTSAKQSAVEGHHLVADGFPQDTARKDVRSFAAKITDGHTDTDVTNDMHPKVTSGI